MDKHVIGPGTRAQIRQLLEDVKARRIDKVEATRLLRGYLDAGTRSERLHALLQRAEGEGRYTSRFTGEEFFLRDHQVRGQRILPGVAYLEMARRAAQDMFGLDAGRPLSIRNVAWVRPLMVGPDGVDVTLALTPRPSGAFGFNVSTGPVHAQGEIGLLDAPVPERVNLNAWHASAGKTRLSGTACYSAFSAAGLEYGPAHQALVELHIAAGESLAHLKLPLQGGAIDDFVLHPSLMDAALQAAVGVLGQQGGGLALPFALREVQVFASCQPEMWARVRDVTQADALMRYLDIDVFDTQGRLCVRIMGFTLRNLDNAAPNLYQPVRRMLIDAVAEVLHVEPGDVDGDTELTEHGFDPVSLAGFGTWLENEYRIAMSPDLLLKYPTLNKLARHLCTTQLEAMKKAIDRRVQPAIGALT